jgi:hypothetical protein
MHRGAACGRHTDEHGLKSHPLSVVHLSALLIVGTIALLAFLGCPVCVCVRRPLPGDAVLWRAHMLFCLQEVGLVGLGCVWVWCALCNVHCMCSSRVRARNHSKHALCTGHVELDVGSMQWYVLCMLLLCWADGSLQIFYLQLVSRCCLTLSWHSMPLLQCSNNGITINLWYPWLGRSRLCLRMRLSSSMLVLLCLILVSAGTCRSSQCQQAYASGTR